MAQTINTNVMSLTAQRNLSRSQGAMSASMARLSSGLRVNSAKDDAAGLAIAERMDAQTRGMRVAIRNANDGISLSQTAEGGLNEISSMLQRMRELTVQALNGTNTDADRDNLNKEYAALNAEIGRIKDVTKFNGQELFTAAASFNFQVGANAGEKLDISTSAITSLVRGISTVASASIALASIDAKMNAITSSRAIYGAAQSRFESAINNLQIGAENSSAARGRIVDTDFAVETANLTRAQILQQAGISMVAQANQSPQVVLSLLG